MRTRRGDDQEKEEEAVDKGVPVVVVVAGDANVDVVVAELKENDPDLEVLSEPLIFVARTGQIWKTNVPPQDPRRPPQNIFRELAGPRGAARQAHTLTETRL